MRNYGPNEAQAQREWHERQAKMNERACSACGSLLCSRNETCPTCTNCGKRGHINCTRKKSYHDPRTHDYERGEVDPREPDPLCSICGRARWRH